MRSKLVCLTVWCVFAASGPLLAQVTYQFVPTDSGNWNVDASWMVDGNPAVVPDFGFSESAQINTGGTAIVDSAVPDIEDLTVSNGVLDVQTTGSLSMLFGGFDTGGRMTIGTAGRVQVAGSGTLFTERGATNNGVLAITGTDADVEIGGNFTNTSSGTVEANISGPMHSAITVGETAVLGGTLLANFDGVTPAFGDGWDIIQANSFDGNFSSVETTGVPALEKGLIYESVISGNTARLEVGNTLQLTVNRLTGELTVSNLIGGDLDVIGYTIQSANQLLDVANFNGLMDQGVGDWQEANIKPTHLAELNLTGSSTLAVGGEVSLGNGYAPGPQPPAMEDLTFTFLTADHQQKQGIVEFTGPINDLVLRIDPETGQGAIQNLSPFIDPFDVTGYSVTSASESLTPGSWNSFAASGEAGEGWDEANPQAAAVAELNLTGSQLFDTNTQIGIGQIFDPAGTRDLIFEFTTTAFDRLVGTVEYGSLEPVGMGLASDFNNDNMVDLQDFNILKANFGATGASMAEGDANMDGNVNLEDFNILKGQFGQSGAAAVPEPSTWLLTILGTAVLFAGSIRRKFSRKQGEIFMTADGPLVPVMLVAFLAVTACGIASAATYEQDFEAADGTTADELGDGSLMTSNTGTAQVLGGRLRLTADDTGSTNANFFTPSLGADATQSWIASFDFELFDAEGGNPPADGFSFNHGAIDTMANGSEEGFGTGLSVEFDTWDNGTGENGHNIAVNNLDVPGGFNPMVPLADGVTRHAEVIYGNGRATLRVDGEFIFRGVTTPGYMPADDYIFAFAARTGGATEDVFIDNLVINAPLPGTQGDFNEDGDVNLDDYSILLGNFNQPGDSTMGDTDFSFFVDLSDFNAFRMAFEAQGAGANAVPEPGTWLLLALGCLPLRWIARRRR